MLNLKKVETHQSGKSIKAHMSKLDETIGQQTLKWSMISFTILMENLLKGYFCNIL